VLINVLRVTPACERALSGFIQDLETPNSRNLMFEERSIDEYNYYCASELAHRAANYFEWQNEGGKL
jgi:hypothetical protein